MGCHMLQFVQAAFFVGHSAKITQTNDLYFLNLTSCAWSQVGLHHAQQNYEDRIYQVDAHHSNQLHELRQRRGVWI